MYDKEAQGVGESQPVFSARLQTPQIIAQQERGSPKNGACVRSSSEVIDPQRLSRVALDLRQHELNASGIAPARNAPPHDPMICLVDFQN